MKGCFEDLYFNCSVSIIYQLALKDGAKTTASQKKKKMQAVNKTEVFSNVTGKRLFSSFQNKRFNKPEILTSVFLFS